MQADGRSIFSWSAGDWRRSPVAGGGSGLEPRFDRGVLLVELVEVGHEVLDDRQVRQREDLDRARDRGDRLRAGERIDAVDVHRAGPADALAAGAAERQGRIDLVLDLDQRVENHRPAAVEVDVEAVHARRLAGFRILAVDAELPQARGARRRRVMPPRPVRVTGIRGQSELCHRCRLLSVGPDLRRNGFDVGGERVAARTGR